MKKVIIGIHGLANKPPKDVLQQWWKDAIIEGFKKLNMPVPKFDFELVYWADLDYPQPFDAEVSDPNHPLYDKEVYVKSPNKGVKKHKLHIIRKFIIKKLETGFEKLYLTDKELAKVVQLTKNTMESKFPDLYAYYYGNCRARGTLNAKIAFRNKLYSILKKHKRKEIFLIAHSMGNIISYDTLSFVSKRIPIHTVMSIGSPLGFAIVFRHILKEHNLKIDDETMASIPDNIFCHWYNLSDIQDDIAINYHLEKHFASNKWGIAPQDIFVENDYEINGDKNHHKSFGYLRTPEMTFAIEDFLTRKPDYFQWWRKKIYIWFKK